MCFSPKIKTPKVNTAAIPEPAPLTDEVKGVEFGGTITDKKEDEGTEVSGKSDLKVDLNKAKTNGVKKTSVKSRMGGNK